MWVLKCLFWKRVDRSEKSFKEKMPEERCIEIDPPLKQKQFIGSINGEMQKVNGQ